MLQDFIFKFLNIFDHDNTFINMNKLYNFLSHMARIKKMYLFQKFVLLNEYTYYENKELQNLYLQFNYKFFSENKDVEKCRNFFYKFLHFKLNLIPFNSENKKLSI
jgi:hypothetical protein